MLDIDISAKLGAFKLDFNARFPSNGISALFGPSGCGKTSVLRCVAGFTNCSGHITLAGTPWLDSSRKIALPAHRRPVGYVFQDARLFTHLNVAGNLAFALKRAPAKQFLSKTQVIEMLDLQALLQRNVLQLSGGERQRVAIARTLLSQPSLLLLDEPLAALDVNRKQELLPYLKRVCDELAIPAIFVSHAIDEVVKLASHTVIMNEGQITAQGATVDVLNYSDTLNRSADIGAVISGKVEEYEEAYQLQVINCEGQHIYVPTSRPRRQTEAIRLYIRGRDVTLATRPPELTSVRNILHCQITKIESDPNTPYADVELSLGQQRLHSRVTRAAVADLQLAAGDPVYALVKAVSLR